jgi:HlyD family secretion protein
MRELRRRLPIALALLVVAAIVALLLRPERIAVETAAVTVGPLEAALEEQGETRVEPRFAVAAPVAGRLLRPALREGDAVRAGEPVAVLLAAPLDPRAAEQARAALAAAEASHQEAHARVAEAVAAHRQAERTRQRMERLAAAGQLAAQELDQARTAERTARETLDAVRHRDEAAEAQVAAARAVLGQLAGGGAAEGRLVLPAPVDGRVLRVFESSERVVPAGTPLLEVGDPSRLEVVVEVLSTDAVALPAGAPMTLDAGAGAALRARLRRVEPAAFTKVSPLGVEEQRVRVVADVLDPAPGVGDRYRVEARIVLWRGERVVRAPVGAVFRHGDGWAAFAVEDGRARRRPLRIGHRSAEEVEVLEGLREGERVVVYPPERLADGARVASGGG